MTPNETQQDYLWDPSAPPDADVSAMERALAGVRLDPEARPLIVPPRPRAAIRRPLIALAIAASVTFAAGAGLWAWRWTWPDGRAWTLHSGTHETPLEVGRGVTVPSSDRAVANIARIGTMRVSGGTSLELRSTRGTRHRLRLHAGDVHVRVWAPPLSVVFETPAGEVIDMGCEFVLSVSGTESRVRVLSGWVQMENGIDEVLIPAGASSEMNTSAAPGVPVFDDAAPGFRDAVRGLERGAGDQALAVILSLARARDVYTLLQLADRQRAAAEPLLRRAAELFPPPGDVTIGGILRGDRQALWSWANALPLPSPKADWWRNWRDALPFWLSR